MQITRRAMLGAGLAAATGHLAAQSPWPAGRPIRMIVPFSAGGATDIAARVVGQVISDSLKTAVVIENKPGAHGVVGISEVMRAPADGHTILMGSIGTMAINPSLHEKIPYDPNKDFAPVALVTLTPIVVVVNPSVLPVKDMRELVRYLKANPGKVNFASAGAGNSGHVVPEYFKSRTGTFMTHIPYKGESAAMADLVGGQVQIMFTTLLNATPHIKSGRIRMLAVTSRQRLPDYPDVPTVAESLNMSDFDVGAWQALYAPAGTPTEIVNRLAAEVDSALKNPAVVKRLAELGAGPGGGTPARLAQFQRAEQERWSKVIRAANIKAD